MRHFHALVLFSALLAWLPATVDAQTRPTSAPTTLPTHVPTSQPASQPKASKAATDPYAGLDHMGTPKLPPVEPTLTPKKAHSGKRQLPRYDGRKADSASAGEVLVWVPRALFLPAWLVMEYGLRWPLVSLTTWAEERYIIERTQRFFTFADGRAGLFPTLFFNFGLNPSAGLFFYFDDLGVKKNRLTLQAGFWINEWIHVMGTNTFKVFRNDEGEVTLRGEFFSRPDRVFSGLNQQGKGTGERFFRERCGEAELNLRTYLRGLNRVSIGLLYHNVDTGSGHDFDEDLSIDAPGSPFLLDAQTGELDPALVPGYGKVYHLLTTQLRLELDTRHPERDFRPGSGLRLELFGSFSFDPTNTDLRFFRWGGEAAGFWDVSSLNHVLALRVYAETIESVGDTLVPFTNRLVLGGPEFLRGFLEGQFRGDSAMVVTLDYRYPVWVLFDANLFVSLGNVFPGRFEQVHVKRMVMSWGLGLRTNTSRDVSLDLLVAFGSNALEQWSEDFDLDNVRVIFGINQGF
ncbi:MAG: BamA/TamA family outer membrane protein [Deltaproteobacteria bacterium]|nr:BamA/TamA family outer membrane protein [Deltaproteobacteria bacterium]